VLEIAFRPDRRSAVPLPRQLADHVAGLIETGRLPAGAKLPATREVARGAALARKTVAGAYEILAERGLVTAHVGQGTFIAGRSTRSAPAAPRVVAPPSPRTFAWAGLFARGAGIAMPASLRRGELGAYPFDFRGGRIDPTSLPLRDLRWAFGRPFETRARLQAIAAHNDPHGWPPLRREIARHLAARGIACDAADVAVVSGLQQAIDLVARVLVEPGDAVAVEQPGYFGATLAFAGRGADLLGIEVDEEGIDTDRLARVLRVRRVKLAYVTPATQCPTGVALSERRREALMALADEHQMPILEDDYDCELRYAGPALPALKAHDAAGQVVYAGTFSKTLFPSLRVGYVVAARPLLERLVTARLVADFGTSVVAQAALTTLLATRGLERHVRRLRLAYAERLSVLLDALEREMPEGTTWKRPRSGLLVWVTLPPRLDPDRLHQAALARGVAYTRGEAFHWDGRGADHVALSFAALAPAAIADGIARLGAVMREQRTAPAARSAGRHQAPRGRVRARRRIDAAG
jgi:GntR family transcriptional regulator/MocR family aminotransferase